ncbi:MAG: DUF4251 domain-containing protein [Tannerella sp.]|jgi:hypothetical protein|nr:DUF4251 domain-containing protein [Tannerella sp.]
MKTIQLFLTAVIAMVMLGFASCSTTNAVAKSEMAQTIKTQIEERHYKIEVARMFPMSGGARSLTSSYSLAINGDSIQSHLPYFGKAYSIPYGGGQGLVFEAPATDYTLNFNPKGTAEIKLLARSQDDTFRYHILISEDGNASIQVTSNNRQPIGYSGKMEEL